MKRMLRYLCAAVLVCGLSGIAKADDFQMVVVDPTVPLDLIQPIYSDDFAINFPTTGPAAGCKSSQLPGVTDPSVYTACFTGINLTGSPLTSLEIEFPTFDFDNALDTPSCPVEGSDAFPTIESCTLVNNDQDYLIEFGGGDIPTATWYNSLCFFDPFASGGAACSSPAIFTIAIGIPGANLIGDGVAQNIDDSGITADANVAVTPEPSSILLLSTGVLSIGLFGVFRRRQSLAVAIASPNPRA